MNFDNLLKTELISDINNHYDDNYDSLRYGQKQYFVEKRYSIKKRLIYTVKWFLYRKAIFKLLLSIDYIWNRYIKRAKLDGYLSPLDSFYNKLEDEASKKLLIKLITYRILGHSKVKLPFHTNNYWNELKELDNSKDENNAISLETFPWKLFYFDLTNFGYSFSIYLSTSNCYVSILREHYKHVITPTKSIGVESGDTVLDLGACFGDTALYFADKVGPSGKIYSFEFIPGNINIFNKNLTLNGQLKHRVTLIEAPVWDTSNKKIYFNDKGPASKVSFSPFKGAEGETSTISIDDFITTKNIQKLDFIKADIEGAEPFMLKGAERTIRKFRPKLAISIYHSMNDFTNIINQIDELDLGYKFYLGHATIHEEETILFCSTS